MNGVPSAAAQVMITIIPIVGIVMGSIVIFFFFLWRHRQRMRMIERGLQPVALFDLETFSLFTGLLTTGVGVVLSVFFIVVEGGSYSLLGGLIPLGVGVSLLTFYAIRRGFPGR